MKQVIVFPRGQLSGEDKKLMIDAGVLVVEADNPRNVVQLIPGADLIDSSDVFMSLLHAVVLGSEGTAFVKELDRRMLKKEQEASPPDTKGE